MDRSFADLLKENWERGRFLCVGLDPDPEKIPEAVRKTSVRETITAFNRALIDATKDIACAYKPNSAFYEAYGEEGFTALRDTCSYIRAEAPEALVIIDAKRADIGHTNRGYAAFAFDHLQADAITLHPYLGSEALEPFLEREEKGAFILCRTSNAGAGEFQDLSVGGEPLYLRVAKSVASAWNMRGNCGLVVGATYPEEIAKVREVARGVPFLIPGVGLQGGDLAASVAAAKEAGGGFVLSVSRAIAHASSGSGFAEAGRARAVEFDTSIRSCMKGR